MHGSYTIDETVPDDRNDFTIGCRILTQPFFFEETDWIPVPPSWSKNIVTFKTYSTAEADGAALWAAVQDCLARSPTPEAVAGAQYGEPTLIRPRLGQGAFRVLVRAGLPALTLPRLAGLPIDTILLGAAAIFLVSFSARIITARSFGAQAGYAVDPNRELTGFGAANLAAGLFGAFPVTASIRGPRST